MGWGHGRTINIAPRRDTRVRVVLFRLVPGLSLLELTRGDVPAHCAHVCVCTTPEEGRV